MEIGIKWQIGRLPLPAPPREYIALLVQRGGITLLPIRYPHALATASLSLLHKDPFDRMLAAQCLEERLRCVSAHPAISAYGVEVTRA